MITAFIAGSIVFIEYYLYLFVFSIPIHIQNTDKQCEKVEQNFDKLKIGMTKQEIIPLIGGERKANPIFNPGKFKEQKSKWEVWALCSDSKNQSKWSMIVFDTKTNRVVKIFVGDPEVYGFD